MIEARREPAIRVIMMPRDTNAHGTIFGGVILSHIDQAGAVAAYAAGCDKVVTVAMDQVEFHQPVLVGDLVSYYAEVVETGRTSIKIRVEVEASRRGADRPLPVTRADIVYVNVDDRGVPEPIPESRTGSR